MEATEESVSGQKELEAKSDTDEFDDFTDVIMFI
jgi:hypothetical protein